MSESGQKPRILAVDDSRVMRVALRRILSADYDVIEAEHGEDAWTLLINDENILTVFTDLSMPYLDGYGLLERMRTSDQPRLQDMPVIIVTGKDDDDEAKQQALDKGASDFISKPFESVQLLARAKTHVKFKQTSKKLTDVSQKLEHQATVDEITGLGGQRYFCKVGEETLAHVQRHGGQYVLIRMDIDNFNQLFIKTGKQFADGILKALGEQLVTLVRKDDMLARVGLSKFALLLRNTPMNRAEEIAQRMKQSIAAMSFKINDKQALTITASIGLYEPDPTQKSDIKTQLESTEQYLKQAIDAGGNQIVSHTDIAEIQPENVNLETALSMLNNGEEQKLNPQNTALLARLMPLLTHLGKNMSDDVKSLIDKITSSFKN